MNQNKKTVFRRSLMATLLCLSFSSHAATSNNLVLESQTMDRSADPCTDFFKYANGKWLAENPIPADRSRYSAYDEVTERNLAALKGIAEAAAAAPDSGSTASRLVGSYYRSGMDEARIEAEGIKPLAEELVQINAINGRDQLLPLIARQHQIGVGSLFNFYVDQDAKKTTRYIPQLVQGGLGLPDRDYYLKTDAKTVEIRKQYLAYVEKMFGLLGDAPALARQNAATVMALETRLAKASMTKVQLRDPLASYHLLDLNGLKKIDGTTAWGVYFKDLGLAEPGQFNVGQPKFFAEAGKMLNSLPLADWKTYLRWNLVNARAKDLSSAFVNTNFDFYGRTLAGTKELQPRWKRILNNIDANMGEAMGELYVAKFFGPEAKAGVLEMVGNIKDAMRDSISKLEWMSEATKQQAYKKLDTLVVKIGYPDTWRDYSALKIDPVSFAGNNMRAAEFEFKRNLAKLGKPIDRNEWGMTPPTVNAYYNPTMNEMVFPAGILQPPLYHVNADAAADYGNTGATIGHELTHAFDDEGRQFDAEGNLKSWWTKEDEKKFLVRVTAIEKQFDEFNPIDKLHINGKLTAGENIADLGGMKIALQALRKAQAGKPQPAEVDGLSVEQRFFIANAQSFRGLMRDEKLRLQLATDPHAPEKYRVLGPIANMPEFSQAFNCPANRSPLRPEAKRVNIW
ncbi:M13 family metallopeptidase [Undibacterium sp.]|uniref:M13 family metallopeptidase n=1 Tax=Undibacterium sp. TaxID=1914977 RepID=UPI002C8332D5|nr:M13 family metallopeptidase [Undibacterium sp.]HTD06537.1 M13 family metallopeptidase [Undibacterium sp.]